MGEVGSGAAERTGYPEQMGLKVTTHRTVANLAQPVYPTHLTGSLPLRPISPWLHPPDPWLMGEEQTAGRGGVPALTEGRPAS